MSSDRIDLTADGWMKRSYKERRYGRVYDPGYWFGRQ